MCTAIIASSAKSTDRQIYAWRGVIDYLGVKERETCVYVSRALRIMILHDPAAELEKMRERMVSRIALPKALSSSIGPSELIFNTLTKEFPKAYIQKAINEDLSVEKTVKDIFAKERAHPEYIPAYHAMNMETFIFTLFTGILHSCIPHSSSVTSFIRFPSSKGFKTIEELFKIYPPYRWNLYDMEEPVRM